MSWFNWDRGFWTAVCLLWFGTVLGGLSVPLGDFILNTCLFSYILVLLWTTRHSAKLFSDRFEYGFPILAVGGSVLFLMSPALGLEFSEFTRWVLIVSVVAYAGLNALKLWVLNREIARKTELCEFLEKENERLNEEMGELNS